MWGMQPTCGLTDQVGWLGLNVGGRLAQSCIHQMNRYGSLESVVCSYSVEIVVVIIIIIIIIIIINLSLHLILTSFFNFLIFVLFLCTLCTIS